MLVKNLYKQKQNTNSKMLQIQQRDNILNIYKAHKLKKMLKCPLKMGK